ncbi:MAG: HAD family hydrolase [Anaerolineales bacterium]|nr:HAD family hydrolase [Anaerolineales bacterium]
MKSLPDFLLLDLDDTILDYTAPGERCWENLCVSFAPKVAPVTAGQLLAAIDQSREWFWSDPQRFDTWRLDLKGARRLVLARAFSLLQVDNLKVSEEIADAFTTLREEMVQPFPGALGTLRTLHDRGIHMGLITNGSAEFQRAKVRRFELEQYFDFILIEGEFGVGKPDPRVFKHGLDQFGAPPEQAWMIGDNLEFDIRPAQELGMDTVWVNYARSSLSASSSVKPTRTIHSLAELIEAA